MHGPLIASAPSVVLQVASRVDWVPLCAMGLLGQRCLRPQTAMLNPLTQPKRHQMAASKALQVRGGAIGREIDLERTEIRLGGLGEYCVVASILLGAVLGT